MSAFWFLCLHSQLLTLPDATDALGISPLVILLLLGCALQMRMHGMHTARMSLIRRCQSRHRSQSWERIPRPWISQGHIWWAVGKHYMGYCFCLSHLGGCIHRCNCKYSHASHISWVVPLAGKLQRGVAGGAGLRQGDSTAGTMCATAFSWAILPLICIKGPCNVWRSQGASLRAILASRYWSSISAAVQFLPGSALHRFAFGLRRSLACAVLCFL